VLNASVTGLLTGLSLIVAIGAQNAFVLRQGLRRARVGPIVAVCTLSDIALIVAGVSGIGAIVQHADWALQAVRWFGVAFLTWYGLSSAWRARRPSALAPSPAGNGNGTNVNGNGANGNGTNGNGTNGNGKAGADEPGLASTIRRAMALTWLNPHVYLDTVVLLGSIANSRGPVDRWWFAVGALVASALWFFGLGFGARFAAPLLATPRAWQVLDLLIAATMLAIAAKLAF
jgi:L-lysine exporter family protein LysE/ArgO